MSKDFGRHMAWEVDMFNGRAANGEYSMRHDLVEIDPILGLFPRRMLYHADKQPVCHNGGITFLTMSHNATQALLMYLPEAM
ncbi:hypothetical protein BO70DRAFT_396435 [Aspergillus heteromorphus CBS 117.55]|uniref:Uncharacterized protein n=1 Tax=Aspergillus heteromorphus CBS 117.55 TaxID=1448321 RepID=A0A317W7T1_9EURO|nr:uncharacterized protein BO70DRAFT_396435 [Aspergillus heteromorphus CBS 117.55]PWY82139.1 hypothetical protein BO70DRAFT_396435 [Aspergillus heteromorphus CBS 117.55]